MNASWSYKRQANADFPARKRRTGKTSSVSPRTGLMKRFRCFVVDTNWDQDLWGLEKWIDLSCWAVIAVSLLFLIPVTLSMLWK
ncbi:MAG: hypothetical protein ABSG75_14335 [Syntrophales bacterium]|jgi:hypothetical protein